MLLLLDAIFVCLQKGRTSPTNPTNFTDNSSKKQHALLVAGSSKHLSSLVYSHGVWYSHNTSLCGWSRTGEAYSTAVPPRKQDDTLSLAFVFFHYSV